MIATGVAARKNILIKDAKTLEALSHIDTVVFDKTGTITTGNLQVVDVVSSDNDFLNIVGSLEKNSNHPLALAINKYVLDHNVEVFEVQNHTTIPGKGIEGTIKDRKYFLGNKKSN